MKFCAECGHKINYFTPSEERLVDGKVVVYHTKCLPQDEAR